MCFSIFLFFIFNFQLLKGLLQKMLNYRLGTVNENHWGLNQFSAAANLTLSQHFLWLNVHMPNFFEWYVNKHLTVDFVQCIRMVNRGILLFYRISSYDIRMEIIGHIAHQNIRTISLTLVTNLMHPFYSFGLRLQSKHVLWMWLSYSWLTSLCNVLFTTNTFYSFNLKLNYNTSYRA